MDLPLSFAEIDQLRRRPLLPQGARAQRPLELVEHETPEPEAESGDWAPGLHSVSEASLTYEFRIQVSLDRF